MANLLSLRPATAILGQERRRCQQNAGGGFDPLRGPSVACSTKRKDISGKQIKSRQQIIQDDRFQETDPVSKGALLRRAHQNLLAQSAVLIPPVGTAQERLCPLY
jgi:hypothetical protein